MPENKNRKDYATEKWEQEVRESLAKKRTATAGVKHSKQDQALINAQLAKESATRQQIRHVQGALNRGIELVSALTKAGNVEVERCVGGMAAALLSSVFAAGSFLVDGRAFDVFSVSLVRNSCRLVSDSVSATWQPGF